MKKRIFIGLLIIFFLAGLGIFAYRSLYTVPVMMYHSIAVAQNDREYANSVSPERFQYQMDFLRRHGYRVLSLDEYVAGRRAGESFCCKSAVITFDDGLENNYTHAGPILREYSFPAAFFVVADFYGREGYLNWEQIKELSRSGITIGSHTVNHVYLPGADRQKRIQEITESKKILESVLGRPVHYLAYPIGGFNEEIKEIVHQAGYQAAFATNRGYDRFNRDVFEVNRIRFKDSDGVIELWAKLSGFYNLFRKSKSPD